MIAVTGSTGFLGGQLAHRLGDEAVGLSRRTGVDVTDVEALTAAFAGCSAVVHCAGINRELGEQTYQRVHIDGTAAVIEACKRAGVERVVLVSYLRARENCGSAYHESKAAAEKLVRDSGLTYAILKPGIIYGRGDHLVDHLSRTALTVPLFATVGFSPNLIAPIPVDEMATILIAAARGELDGQTVSVIGAETISLKKAMRRVGAVIGRRTVIFPMPVFFHTMLATVAERVMKVPLLARSQVRMLSEGVITPAQPSTELPAHLRPRKPFSAEEIRAALPALRRFGRDDLLGRRSSRSRQRG